MSQFPYVNETIKDEHNPESNTKRVALYGWDSSGLEAVRITATPSGEIKTSGTTTIDTTGLATEDKQDDIITAINNITIPAPVGGATEAEQQAQTTLLTTIEANQLADNHQVTANAGTNLNTSALALESGGNLSTLAGKDFATSAKQDTLIGHVDGLEGLLTTIDADTSALASKDFATETTLASLVVEMKITNGAYAMQVDDAGSGVTYQGWAVPGPTTSSAGWRIKRITQTGDDYAIVFADGNANFDNIWDNRAGLSYS
jgi:hypothetical protein